MKFDRTEFTIWLSMKLEWVAGVIVIIGGAVLFWLTIKPH